MGIEPMAEVATIDVRCATIKFCHGASDGTCQASADIPGGAFEKNERRQEYEKDKLQSRRQIT